MNIISNNNNYERIAESHNMSSSYLATGITNVSLKEPRISIKTVSQNLSISNIWDIMSGFGTLHNINVCEYNSNGDSIISAVIDFDRWNDDFMTRNLRTNLLSGDSELLTYDYKKGKQITLRAVDKSGRAHRAAQRETSYNVLCDNDIYDRHHR